MPRYAKRCRLCDACLRARSKLPCRSPLSAAEARERSERERPGSGGVMTDPVVDGRAAALTAETPMATAPILSGEPEVLRRELARVLERHPDTLVLRCAHVGDVWLYSVLDAVALVTRKSRNPRVVFKRLKDRFPDIVSRHRMSPSQGGVELPGVERGSSVFKFEGRGQKPTPVSTQTGILEIMVLASGPTAASFRANFCALVDRLLGDGNSLRVLVGLSHVRLALDGQGATRESPGGVNPSPSARTSPQLRSIGMTGDRSLYLALSKNHIDLVKIGITRNFLEREKQLSAELGDVCVRVVYAGAGDLEILVKRQQKALQVDVAGRRRVFTEFYRMTLEQAEAAVANAHESFLAAQGVTTLREDEAIEREFKRRRLEIQERAEAEKARLELDVVRARKEAQAELTRLELDVARARNEVEIEKAHMDLVKVRMGGVKSP